MLIAAARLRWTKLASQDLNDTAQYRPVDRKVLGLACSAPTYDVVNNRCGLSGDGVKTRLALSTQVDGKVLGFARSAPTYNTANNHPIAPK